MEAIYVTETVLPALQEFAAHRGVTLHEAAHCALKQGLGIELWFGLQVFAQGQWRTVRRFGYVGEALEAWGGAENYRVVDTRVGQVLDWTRA